MKKLLTPLLFPLMIFAQESTLIGDVDCSGEVNAQDASLILQFVTNEIDSLPCQQNLVNEIIINNHNSGGSDFYFPDGFTNDIIYIDHDDSYTVPLGKTFYATSLSGDYSLLLEDGGYYNLEDFNNLYDENKPPPIVIPEGSIINPPTNNINNQQLSIFGFLVDSQTEIILTPTPYTVPDEKILCFLNGIVNVSYDNEILNNGVFNQSSAVSKGIMFKAGTVLGNPYNGNSSNLLNGYLVDEDYFTDSSGGGGSTINSDFWSLINDTLNTDFNIRLNSSNFHIVGNNFTDFIISNDSVGDPSIWLRDVDSLVTWRLHNDQSRGNIFSIRPWNNFSDFGGTTNIGLDNDPFSIDTLGRVSIGNGQLFKEKFNLFNNGSTFFNIESSSNNDAGIIISELSGARGARIIVDGDDLNNLIFQVTNDSGEYVDVLHMPFFPESEVGNVGIGIQNPSRKLHVNDVMRIEPRISPPDNPSKGDIYMDDIDNKLKVFDGVEWQSCF